MKKIETTCAKCGKPQLLEQVPTRVDGWYGVGCTECQRSYFFHWVDGKVVDTKAMKSGRAATRKKKGM